jgi:hypothetical protein
LQQLLEGAAASGRVRTPWPLLLFGPGRERAAPLLIAFLAQKQMAAVGANLSRAGAAAEADRPILDRDRGTLTPAAAGQVPLALVGGQAMAMGIANVIEDHRLQLPWCGTQHPGSALCGIDPAGK